MNNPVHDSGSGGEIWANAVYCTSLETVRYDLLKSGWYLKIDNFTNIVQISLNFILLNLKAQDNEKTETYNKTFKK